MGTHATQERADSSPVKLCRDCRYQTPLLSYCLRPIAIPLDIVTGATTSPLFKYLSDERRPKRLFGRDRCGPSARYFEARD